MMEQLPLGSCGVIIGNIECMVIDVKTGRELGVDETGEFWVRGPTVVKGYYNNPKATTETIDKDGWLHTGSNIRRGEHVVGTLLTVPALQISIYNIRFIQET